MRSAVTGRQLPLLGGAICLDFANTIDPRFGESREEFLHSFAALAEWGRFVGLLTSAEGAAMLAEGDSNPQQASDAFRRAIELREAIYHLFKPWQRPPSGALEILNRELQQGSMSVAVERRKREYHLVWRTTTIADGLVGAVARSAAELLSSPDLERVRECAGSGCGWLFLDTSKAHRRRWCSMAICGNRTKAQRQRQRVRLSKSAAA
jgi:predicted RNA-binding Zn ribbon-like protein